MQIHLLTFVRDTLKSSYNYSSLIAVQIEFSTAYRDIFKEEMKIIITGIKNGSNKFTTEEIKPVKKQRSDIINYIKNYYKPTRSTDIIIKGRLIIDYTTQHDTFEAWLYQNTSINHYFFKRPLISLNSRFTL